MAVVSHGTINKLRPFTGVFVCGMVLLVFFSFFHERKVYSGQDSCPSSIAESGENVRVLVTGAAGFIGSHVVKACVDLGMTVIGVDDMSGGFYENVPVHKRVTFIKADVKDAVAMSQVFERHGPITYVYHLAAYAAEGLSHFIPSYNYRNNLVGSVEVLSLAIKHKVKCFVFTSSIAAYGAVTGDMREDVQPHPEDPYGVSKYAMELHLKAAHEMYGMNYVIFRPHNVYGPNQNIHDKYRNVVGIFMNQLLLNQPLTIFGDGMQTRSFSYIDDVAPIIAISPLYKHARNQIFNVGADVPYTLNSLANYISEAMGKETKVVHLPQRLEVVHSTVDNTKVRCYFRLGAPTDLRTGLNRTATWVKGIGKTYSAVEFKAVEILDHLPPSWKRPDLLQEVKIEHTSVDNPTATAWEAKLKNKQEQQDS